MLLPGTRLVIYSDGVSERRHDDGSLLGFEGIRATLRSIGDCSAEGTVLGLQEAVRAASHRPLRDDATLLVLAPTA
jgi:serine phosphatase RsbU (regulator of sigma subunit)